MTPHPVDLEALQKLLDKVEALPWIGDTGDADDWALAVEGTGAIVAYFGPSDFEFEQDKAHADLILAAVNALPALLAEVRAARQAIEGAPHGFACLSFTIIEGAYPTYRDAPPQVFKPRQPPDESLCNCWKRAALASPSVPPPPKAQEAGAGFTPAATPEGRLAQWAAGHDPYTPAQEAGEETVALKEGASRPEEEVHARAGDGRVSSEAGGQERNSGEGMGAQQRESGIGATATGGCPAEQSRGAGSDDRTRADRGETGGSGAGQREHPAAADAVATPGPVSQQPGTAPALRDALLSCLHWFEEEAEGGQGDAWKMRDLCTAALASDNPRGAPPSAPALPKEEVAPDEADEECVCRSNRRCPVHSPVAHPSPRRWPPQPLPEEQLSKEGSAVAPVPGDAEPTAAEALDMLSDLLAAVDLTDGTGLHLNEEELAPARALVARRARASDATP